MPTLGNNWSTMQVTNNETLRGMESDCSMAVCLDVIFDWRRTWMNRDDSRHTQVWISVAGGSFTTIVLHARAPDFSCSHELNIHQRTSPERGHVDLLGEVSGGGRYEELAPATEEIEIAGNTYLVVKLDKLIQCRSDSHS